MNAELRSTFLQTHLMPDTWNTFESVQFVSTEIETYVRNYSLPSRISQLIWLQWIVILPVLHEFQQKFLIFDSHVTANRKFGYIRSFFSSHCITSSKWSWHERTRRDRHRITVHHAELERRRCTGNRRHGADEPVQ